jgi:hypothetical protein
MKNLFHFLLFLVLLSLSYSLSTLHLVVSIFSCVVFPVSSFFQQQSSTSGNENYYKVLGLKKEASGEDIKKSYRNLAKQYHPDKNPQDRENAEKKFIEISKAYEILSDPQQKAAYDDELSMNSRSGQFSSFGNNQRGGGFNRAQQWRNQRNGGAGGDPFRSQDPFDMFRHHFQQDESSSGYEEKTYVYQGQDGRMYYQTVRTPKGKTKTFSFEFSATTTAAINYFFQYLFIPLLPLLLILCCNCCCPSASSAVEDERRQQRRAPPSQSSHSSTQMEGEEIPESTVLARIPLLTNQFLLRKGVITIVSMSDNMTSILLSLQRYFKNDPLLFTQYHFGCNEEIDSLETALEFFHQEKDDSRRKQGENTPSLVAFAKNGKKFLLFVVDDFLEEIKSDDIEKIQLLTKKWLEKIVEGTVSWNTIATS